MEVLGLQLIVTTFVSLSQGCAFHQKVHVILNTGTV